MLSRLTIARQALNLLSTYSFMTMEQGNINWNDVIKKEARGINNEDLGEVKEVGDTYILVQKGLINKEKYYIPQNKIQGYDGSVLHFKISEEEMKTKYFQGSLPPELSAADIEDIGEKEEGQVQKENEQDESIHVQAVQERLNVSKGDVIYKEPAIIKEPLIETQTVEVSLNREELIVERRPASQSNVVADEIGAPVTSKQEIRIPLKKEEVQVRKEPYVKEEVILKKIRVSEKKTITEKVKGERILNTSESNRGNIDNL
jgi:uncharacterized protein (TIGR02271 family)